MDFPDLPPLGQMLVNDPFWRYQSGTAAAGGVAHLRTWATSDNEGRRVAVVTETGLGSSITNSIEHIWSSLVAEAPGVETVLLEHWPAEAGAGEGEHLDQVVVDNGQPQWRRIWPTPESNPLHDSFESWMNTQGQVIIH